MHRRRLLQTTVAAATWAALGPKPAPAARQNAPPRKQPNILLIISDEHNASVTGCYGNRIVRTPVLDKLAARGVTFDAAYTNSPLCVPCRLSVTACKYISRIGAWSNSCWLPSDDYPSIARAMTAAGYDSLLCGKMHYDRTRRYGFTEIAAIGNRSFKTGRGSRRRAGDLTPRPKISGRFNQFHPGDNSGVLTHDRKVTAGVVDFLARRTKADRPFFMIAGYLAPHFPLIVPQRYWTPYKGKVPMPKIPPGHLQSLPRNYKHLRVGFQMVGVPAGTVRRGRELYYGLTQWLDEEIGKVLAALNRSEQAGDTVVIYTTDHGENIGEHGLWWKNCMYDHAARVPLIVSWPRRWKGPQRRAGACSLVDLVQTIAELGAAKAPADWDGDSMLAWLDDPDAKWKDLAVSEYFAHNIASGYAMLRSGRYKYVCHARPDASGGREHELYDLKADPGEFDNLAGDPKHKDRIRQMHAVLVRELGRDVDEIEKQCRSDYARGYGRKSTGRRKKKKDRPAPAKAT